jgi:hypothetical protein
VAAEPSPRRDCVNAPTADTTTRRPRRTRRCVGSGVGGSEARRHGSSGVHGCASGGGAVSAPRRHERADGGHDDTTDTTLCRERHRRLGSSEAREFGGRQAWRGRARRRLSAP